MIIERIIRWTNCSLKYQLFSSHFPCFQLMKKNALADRVSSLQEALATLHEATEKREVLEETLRLRLEEEIRNLKKERQGNWRQSAPVMSPSGITMVR